MPAQHIEVGRALRKRGFDKGPGLERARHPEGDARIYHPRRVAEHDHDIARAAAERRHDQDRQPGLRGGAIGAVSGVFCNAGGAA